MPTIDLDRQKLAINNALSANIAAATPTEIDAGNEEATFVAWRLASTNPPAFNVVSSAANGSTTLTTAVTNGFANVAVGDVVTGTGIAASSTVAAKVSSTQVTLNNATTAAITNGTITFDPPAITPTVFALKVNFTPYAKPNSANTRDGVNLSFTLYVYDGSLLGTNGSDANATKVIPLVTNAANGAMPQVAVDLEAYYTAIRVPKSA